MPDISSEGAVWVSAAAGAVGSVAAQLKARGASLVIGSAGGAEKARYLTGTLGLDAAVDYRAGHLAEQLSGVAPEGIDLYFDNVGGDHLEAAMGFLVLDHLQRRAAFEDELLPLVEDGTLHSDVTIFDGLESAPRALLSLLDGSKPGKALVRP